MYDVPNFKSHAAFVDKLNSNYYPMKYCIQRTSLQIVVTIFWKSNSMYFSIDDRIWGLSLVQIPNRIYFQPNHNQNKTHGSFSYLKKNSNDRSNKRSQRLQYPMKINSGFRSSVVDSKQYNNHHESSVTHIYQILHVKRISAKTKAKPRQWQQKHEQQQYHCHCISIWIYDRFNLTVVGIEAEETFFLAVTLLTTHSLTLAVYTNAHRTLTSSALE